MQRFNAENIILENALLTLFAWKKTNSEYLMKITLVQYVTTRCADSKNMDDLYSCNI